MPITDAPYSGPRITGYHRLGGGVVRPFVRASHGDFASDQGVPAVLANVGQLLGTAKGTLPWRPEFGSDLERLRHQANTPTLRDLAAVFVREAIALWEPRARLVQLRVPRPAPGSESTVDLRATLEIEGEPGQHTLHLNGHGGRPSFAEALGYSVASSARVPRGMGPVAEPPIRVVPPQSSFVVGIVRPVHRARDFNSGSGITAILSNVGEVLGTAKGTLPWRPEFGSDLHRLRHMANTPTLRELARLYVDEALTRWEPRAQVVQVDVLESREEGGNVINVRALCRVVLSQDATIHSFDVAVK